MPVGTHTLPNAVGHMRWNERERLIKLPNGRDPTLNDRERKIPPTFETPSTLL